jgi:phytoene dehydrogenase-like protein
MNVITEAARQPATKTAPDFDAIVIGAGVSGLYQLYRLRELGMRARVFEAGSGVGGTVLVQFKLKPSHVWKGGHIVTLPAPHSRRRAYFCL